MTAPGDGSPPPPPDGAADASASARPGHDASPAHGRRSLVRRLVPLGLVLGVSAVLSPLADRWPSSHPVEVTIEAPSTARRLDVAVRRATDGEDVHQGTWRFAKGRAPDRVHLVVQAPDGSYDVQVDVERDGGARASRVHHVDLGDGRTVVHAR